MIVLIHYFTRAMPYFNKCTPTAASIKQFKQSVLPSPYTVKLVLEHYVGIDLFVIYIVHCY